MLGLPACFLSGWRPHQLQVHGPVTHHKCAEALRLYGEALAGAPSNAVLLSNRSAAAAAAGDPALALADARAAVNLRPDWAKAHFRQHLVCMGFVWGPTYV